MAAAECDWYVLGDANATEGPFTEAEIAERIADGRLSADSMVWRAGWPEWKRLADADSAQEPDASPAASARFGGPIVSPATACPAHANALAKWFCRKCQTRVCDACVRVVASPTVRVVACRECGRVCRPVDPASSEPQVAPGRGSFSLFLGAFAYPLKGNGKIMLLLGSIFIALLRIETPAFVGMYVGGAKVVLGAFAAAYILAFLFKIARASAIGESQMPDWPKAFGEGADLTWPIPVMIKITLIGWGIPIAMFLAGVFFEPWLMLAAIPVALVGAFYVPLATLNGALGGQEYIRPDRIMADAFRTFRSYVAALIALSVICLVVAVAEFAAKDLAIPIVSHFAGILISFYVSMVEMRILGLIYHTNEDRLDWDVAL